MYALLWHFPQTKSQFHYWSSHVSSCHFYYECKCWLTAQLLGMNNRIFGLKLKILNLWTGQPQKTVQSISEKKCFVITGSHSSIPTVKQVNMKSQSKLGCHNYIVGTALFPEQLQAVRREVMDVLYLKAWTVTPSVLFLSTYPLNKIFFRPDMCFSYLLVCMLLSYAW